MDTMPNDKKQILLMLKEIFAHWEEFLAGLSEEQINVRQLPSDWSIKDVVAHLMAWQQVSIAKLEAAALNRVPEFPTWSESLDPASDAEEEVEQANTWIYESNRERPWGAVYKDWREGFIRFVELGEEVPEAELLDAEKYKWMRGYALSDSILGSCEHHQEHLESLLA